MEDIRDFTLCHDVDVGKVTLWRGTPLFVTQDFNGYWKAFTVEPYAKNGNWVCAVMSHGKNYILLAKSHVTPVATEQAILRVVFPE